MGDIEDFEKAALEVAAAQHLIDELTVKHAELAGEKAQQADLQAFSEKINHALTYNGDGTEKAGRPVRSLGWLRQSLGLLGVDTGFLAPAEAAERRASELRRRTFTEQQVAAQKRTAALQRLVADPDADLDQISAEWLAASPWLDIPVGAERPPLAEMLRNARRQVEAQVGTAIYAVSEHIFTAVQKRARELVEEVRQLPAFPPNIWLAPSPAEVLGRIPAHRGTWGVLDATRRDFELAVDVALSVRDSIGAGPDSLPDGAPRSALVFRNWRAWQADGEFGRVRPELRLRYASEHDLQPGIWRPGDIVTTAADRTFGAKLRNLGVAVGMVS